MGGGIYIGVFMNNYQLLLDKEIEKIVTDGKVPKLLLHSCCAPCSSYCLEYLSKFFEITVLYFNPNIEDEEYNRRLDEQKRFARELKTINSVNVVSGRHNTAEFYSAIKGYEKEKEGGKRCEICFRLRLSETAKYAKENGFDYFTTTLTISPLKNAELLNMIGEECAKEFGVKYLFSDFKKKGGYLRSVELSKEYLLYRQDYCGCIFSKR